MDTKSILYQFASATMAAKFAIDDLYAVFIANLSVGGFLFEGLLLRL